MSGFWRGNYTLFVSSDICKLNRERLCAKLLAEYGGLHKAVVILQGGIAEMRHCSDHELLFRQESYFHWLFGVEEPDFYGALDISTGKSYLFPPLLPDAYGVWMGKLKNEEDFKKIYGVDEVYFSSKIGEVLSDLHPTSLLTLFGQNTDSDSFSKEATFEGIEKFMVNNSILHPIMSELRVFKTDMELDVLRYTNQVSSLAHREVMKNIRPGMYEYQMESIFKHFCQYFGGIRILSYTCVCGSGTNSSVLHYGHAGEPNKKAIKDGDMCLFDMGGEYFCYASDITTSFPANGVFTENQRNVYNAVLTANRAVISAVKPGVSWVDMHLLAERCILECLKEMGLVIGDVDEMLDCRLGAVFMPHGLGHFMGVDTHDVGGFPQGYERIQKPGLKSLRTTRELQARMVITVEPGLYFIDQLIDAALEDTSLSRFLVPSKLEEFRNFGGVRIEDNVIITESGCELMTQVPRTVDEIEALMREGRKNDPPPTRPFDDSEYKLPIQVHG